MSAPQVSPAPSLTRGKSRFLSPAHQLEAYSSFLPSIAIEQLQADLGPEPPKLPGTTCEAAVMFSDASGFTALTEKLAQRPDGAELMCEVRDAPRSTRSY